MRRQTTADDLLEWVTPHIRKQVQRRGRFRDDTVDDLVQSTILGIMRRQVWQKIKAGNVSGDEAAKLLKQVAGWEAQEAIRDFASKEKMPRYALAGTSTSCVSVDLATEQDISVSHAAYALSTKTIDDSAESSAMELMDRRQWDNIIDELATADCIAVWINRRFVGLNCALLAERLRAIIVTGEHKQLQRAELLNDLASCDMSALPDPLACVIERLVAVMQCSPQKLDGSQVA